MKYNKLTTMQFKVTRLKIQKPRKGEMWTRNASLNTGGAVGSIRGTDGTSVTTSVGGGKGCTITRTCGIGKEMVSNLDRVKARAKKQYLEDRKAFIREGC